MNDSVGDAELLGMLAEGAPEAVTESEPDPLADKHSEGLTLSVPHGVGVKDVVTEIEGVVVTVCDKDTVVQRVAVRAPRRAAAGCADDGGGAAAGARARLAEKSCMLRAREHGGAQLAGQGRY